MLLFVGFTIHHRKRSGIHRVVVETARALSGLVELDLVRWDASVEAPRYLDAAEIDALFGPGAWPEGVRVRPTARRVGGSFWREAGELGDAWLLAPEVAWHETNGNAILAAMLRQCRGQGLRTAALCYDLIPIRNPVYRDGAALHAAYLRELAGCDLVLPISRDCGAQLLAWWGEQGVAPLPPTEPVLLPDGGFARDVAAAPGEPTGSERPWIVLLGTVEPRKRQLFFLEAMRRARAGSGELARYEAVVVGALQPSVADAFEEFVAANPWVRFLDYASDAEVARLLRGARFTVFASDDEGYGLPIAESLAAGTPCLCADFGAMGEIAVGGGCLAVDVRSERALGEALVRLCEQPAELARLRAEIADRPFRSWRDYALALLARMGAVARPAATPAPASAGVELSDQGVPDPPGRFGRVVVAPLRLAQAVRRNGLGPVLGFGVETLRRRGVWRAVRLAFAGREQRATMADPHDAPRARKGSQGPPNLDEAYAMSPAAWTSVFGDAAWDGGREAEGPAGADATLVVGGTTDDGGEGAPDHWVVFLKAGDRLGPTFTSELARATRDGVAEVVSFDMVRRTGSGDVQPLSVPGANPTLYRHVDHLFGRLAIRADLLAERSATGAEARAFVLDELERTSPVRTRGRWRHIASPVVEARVSDDDIATERRAGRRESLPEALIPSVTAVIAMAGGAAAPDLLVRDLLRRSEQAVAKVVVVAGGSSDAQALVALDAYADEPRIEVLRSAGEADLPRLYTHGASVAATEGPLLFLDATVMPQGDDWLERLVACLQTGAEVGAVGPLLRDPERRVSSAGLYLRRGGAPGHVLRGTPAGGEGYLFLLAAPREVSGLSGAALLTRREVFAALGGFDAALGPDLFDIDYGRRVAASGWTNVFEPAAVAIAGRPGGGSGARADRAVRSAALARYRARWRDADGVDRLYPGSFDPSDESLRRLAVAEPVRDPAGRRPARPAR